MNNYPIRFLLALILSFAALATAIFPAFAGGFDVKSARLQILWTTPIINEPVPTPVVGKPGIPPRRKGLLLDKATKFPDDRIVFLGSPLDTNSFSSYYSRVLLIYAEQHSPEEITKFQLKGTPPEQTEPTFLEKLLKGNKPSDIPAINSLAAGSDGTIWVGGLTHDYMDIASGTHSDAYLAKLDSHSTPQWERAYKTSNKAVLVDMTPTSTGDLVVVTDSLFAPSWLGLIAASDGHLIWERNLGNGKGIALVQAHKDRFIVASFDSEGTDATYQENVSVRTVSTDGQMGSATIIRKAINKDRSGYYGGLKMSATEDGAYVESNWEVSFLSNPSLLQPSEIAKVTAEGKLLWSKVLPDSFKLRDGGGATFCSDPAIATLPNGDALVACALNGQIHLHKFDQNTGNDEQSILVLPPAACDGGGSPGSMFLFVRKDGTVLLSGSWEGYDAIQGCSWLGYLTTK